MYKAVGTTTAQSPKAIPMKRAEKIMNCRIIVLLVFLKALINTSGAVISFKRASCQHPVSKISGHSCSGRHLSGTSKIEEFTLSLASDRVYNSNIL